MALDTNVRKAQEQHPPAMYAPWLTATHWPVAVRPLADCNTLLQEGEIPGDTDGTVPAPLGELNPIAGSGLHPQFFLAEAQKASWAGIPDSLLVLGKSFVGARAQQDLAGPGSNSAPLRDALGIAEVASAEADTANK